MSTSTQFIAPPLFDRTVDRQVALPSFYLPDAAGALIVSKDMLRMIELSFKHAPRGWTEYRPGVFRKPVSKTVRRLQVRQCVDEQTDLWVIELLHRQMFDRTLVDALVCAFSGRPIWASTCQDAMRLAEHCYPLPRSLVAGHWVRAY